MGLIILSRLVAPEPSPITYIAGRWGQINVVGYLGGKEGLVNPLQILQSHARVRGIAVGPTSSLKQLCKAFEHSTFRPIIDSQFGWLDHRQAFNHLSSTQHVGKIVLNL